MGELLLVLPPCLPQFPHLVRGASQVRVEKSHTGRGVGGGGIIPLPPRLRGLKEETAWDGEGHSRRGKGKLDTLPSRLQNKCFYF